MDPSQGNFDTFPKKYLICLFKLYKISLYSTEDALNYLQQILNVTVINIGRNISVFQLMHYFFYQNLPPITKKFNL